MNPFENLKGKSQIFLNAVRIAEKASEVDVPVLLEGETGTGKDLFAKAIHYTSSRKTNPFRAINCSAISSSLAESEFFGYDGGAFTGSNKNGKPGIFEQAHRGTVFLDEIGEMPVDLQVKLLRVIENKTICRVGGSKEIPVDVRIICATNKNVRYSVEKGNFREDLYFRICVMNINLPPLRERKEDIPFLANYFAQIASNKYNKTIKKISPQLIQYLVDCLWPGNIRELRHTIEKEVIFAKDGEFELNHIPDNLSIDEECLSSKYNLKLVEKKAIEKALFFTMGNSKKAAKLLGISRTTLYRKVEEYEIKID